MLSELARTYANRSPVGSVAVVGNAPLSPSDSRAAAVDAADLVLRVNGFRTDDRDGPPAAGRRTDVVVFNRAVRPTPWFFDDYRSRLYLMVEPGRMFWEREEHPNWWPTDLGEVSVSNRDVIIPLGSALGIDSERDGVWATTGTVMAWLARAMFPDARLSMTGFSFIDRPRQDRWEHAYGDPCAVAGEHLILRESSLLRGWLHDPLVTLLR